MMTLTESLPADERWKLWLPEQDFILTLGMPDGHLRMFRQYRCPFTGQIAHNIAEYEYETQK